MAESSLARNEENVINGELALRLEKICDICDVEKKTSAEGFCQQCGQHLCTRCCLQHGKIVGTKHHKIRANDTDAHRGDSLFGKKLMILSKIVLPVLPSDESPARPQVKYANFYEDTNILIVLCWYPETNFYAFSKLKDNEQVAFSIGILETEVICLDMKDQQVIAVYPSDNIVSSLDIDKPFFTAREMFKTTGECKALVEFDNGFAAAIGLPTTFTIPTWQIQYLDRLGRIKHRIAYNTDGDAYFETPAALATNNTQSMLYVLDETKDLNAFNVAGELVFKFSSEDMASPIALTLDGEGNMYVACEDSVLQIGKDGTDHHETITKNEHAASSNVLAFNADKELMLVGDGSETLMCLSFTDIDLKRRRSLEDGSRSDEEFFA